MDPHLLDYYNQELVYMRELAGEFAEQHPKIARRLGMHGIEVADPYVERLIEAFCFMSARMRIKLDAEFPRFTQRLLEVVYPNYVSPTPSMAVAQLHPSVKEGDFSKGFAVPRGSAFFAKVPQGEETACEFRSGQDTVLWPIEIVDARLTGAPPDIPALERYLPAHVQVTGSLRLRLRMVGQLNFSDLRGLDRLPIYLSGDDQVASHLCELLHTSAVATFTGAPGHIAERPHVVTEGALVHEGLQGAQALRDMLRLFVNADDVVAHKQIQSLIGSRIEPVTRRLPGSGPLVYGRGVQCALTVDENGFSGGSPYLFGLVLEHYLARHVSINVFTQTVLHAMQRGEVARWPVRMGGRGVV